MNLVLLCSFLRIYRHTQSLNLDVDCCGKCIGKLQLITNNEHDKQNKRRQASKKNIRQYELFVRENLPIMKQNNQHLSTRELMKQINLEYEKRNQQDIVDLPADLDRLKL